MKLRRNHSPAIAGAKAGFSTATAYRFERHLQLPGQKKVSGTATAPTKLRGVR